MFTFSTNAKRDRATALVEFVMSSRDIPKQKVPPNCNPQTNEVKLFSFSVNITIDINYNRSSSGMKQLLYIFYRIRLNW